jgi:type I restriction enzyme S subunit
MGDVLERLPLGAVSTITTGQSPDSATVFEGEGGLPFLQGCAEFGPKYPNTPFRCSPPLRVAKAGSILISVRAPVGTSNIADQDYCIGRGLAAIAAKSRAADTAFVYYAISDNLQYLHQRSQGSTFLAIGSKDLRSLPIVVPSLSIQQRIAEILLSVDSAIEYTELQIAKLEKIKSGMMHDLFTRGVLPDGRLRPTRAEAQDLYKHSSLGWIPLSWDVGSPKDCGSIQLGRQRDPTQMSGRWMRPYLRVANVLDGFIDYSDVLAMNFTPLERETFSLKPGDILLNEGQSLELVGRCAKFDGPVDVYCFQNTLIRFRHSEAQSASFYRHLFKWYLDCGQFMRIAKQTTSVAHLGADRFARMESHVVPFEEQERIAQRLDGLQDTLDREALLHEKLGRLKLGLMHDLLTGRVRVPEEAAA